MEGNEDVSAKGDIVIQVTLSEYLKRLEGLEAEKPPSQRRPVPSLTELARATGVHRVTLTNLANNNVKLINVGTLTAVFNELRRRGFEVEITDLLAAYPAEEAKQPA